MPQSHFFLADHLTIGLLSSKARPWLRVVQILSPHSSINTVWVTTAWPMNQFPYSTRFCRTSGRFLSAGRGLANFTKKQFWNFVSPYCLSLLHKCLAIRGIECNFSINDCLLTPLIVPLYAYWLIECLFFTYDCQKMLMIFFWFYWLSIARV